MDNTADYLETGGIGTVVYMAPEVIRGRSTAEGIEKIQYKKTADIYSLTLILHELFGGGSKFFPKRRPIELMGLKFSGVGPRLQLESLPASLRTVIQDGVDNDPKKRTELTAFSDAINKAAEKQ